MPATIFESEMLANRVEGYNPSDLDAFARPARSSGAAWSQSETGTDVSRST